MSRSFRGGLVASLLVAIAIVRALVGRARRARHSVAFLVLALAIACVGCHGRNGKPQRRITSIHSIGGYGDAARVLAVEFEQRTGIHVEILEAPFLTLREKEVTALTTGSTNFDVMQIAYQWEGETFPYLRPLDEIAPGVLSSLDDFIPTVRSNCGQWQGRVYALPMACDAVTLLYRKDIFASRSAEFEKLTGRPLQPPRTWEEYLEIARFLNSDTMYGNVLMGSEQCFTIWSGILYANGGRLLDDDWRPVLNSDAGVRSLETLVEMFKTAPPGSEELSIQANSIFLQGRGAMLVTWPSLIWTQLSETNSAVPSGSIGAAVIPGGKPQLSAWSLSINPKSNDLEAAAKWIEFCVSPENSKRLLLRYGKGSPRISTYADPECGSRIFFHSQLLEGLAGSQARLRIPPSQELSDYLDSEILRAIRAQTTPKAALDRTAARWREILTQAGYLKGSAE